MVSLSKILSPTARGKWTLRLLRSIDPENMRCNIKSGAESCKPFLSIGISTKLPSTESLILQSKPTLCTFHHHAVYRDKFSSIYRKIKCCAQENRCCIDKSWTLFDKKKEVCELRACHKKDNKDTKLDNKSAICSKWDNDFSSIKCCFVFSVH